MVFKSNLFENIVDCEWDDWQTGECDEQCGGGMRTNTRAPKVDAQHGGEECTGSSSITESCNEQECPGIHKNIGKNVTSLIHQSIYTYDMFKM